MSGASYVRSTQWEHGKCCVCRKAFTPRFSMLRPLEALIYCGDFACENYTSTRQGPFREDTPERREILGREWDAIQHAQDYMTSLSPGMLPPEGAIVQSSSSARGFADGIRDQVSDSEFGRIVDQSGLMVARPAYATARVRIVSLPTVAEHTARR